MATAFTPPTMNWQANDIPDEFAKFKQYCGLIFDGPFSKKNASEKASYILLWIGRQGVDIYNSFTWEDEADKTKPETIWSKYEQHLAPRSNYRLARYQLQQLTQSNDENTDDFMARCRNQAAKCKFRDQREIDERVIEQLIIGTKHKKAQERILEHTAALSLDQAIDYARTYEATLEHVAKLHNNDVQNIHNIGKSDTSIKRKCRNCANEHEPNKCPAYGSLCNFCSKPNHWSKACRLKARTANNSGRLERNQLGNDNARRQQYNRDRTNAPGNRGNRRVHALKTEDDDPNDEFDTLLFESIHIHSVTPGKTSESNRKEILVNVEVTLPNTGNHRTLLKAKIDTGAQANILPLRLYCTMFPQNIGKDRRLKANALKASNTLLTAYGGAPIPQLGTCDIHCAHEGQHTTATFYVTDMPGRAIIGLLTAVELNLLSLNCPIETNTTPENKTLPPNNDPLNAKERLIKQHPSCFDGIGKFQGEYHITLDPTTPPVIHAPRRVPISLRDDIKRELDDMIAQDIITKVREGEPTAWVNSLVYRRKPNGKLRICLDPKDLNAAIQRDHHVTPTLEEILPKLSGAKFFTIVDAKSGYWNVVLDRESSYVTTFNSPFGRYRFKRMPFGLRMSQDVFQSKIDQTFEGCEGVVGIADDIVVYGRTEEEHDCHLRGMIKRCEETGLKLNPDKCHIKQPKIKFYGIICGESGIQPDPAKVSAIQQMAKPIDRRELQTFLGLATYMGPFIQSLSALTSPLRELLKENGKFIWNADYQAAFDKIKTSISKETTLTYFNDSKGVTLQVDASTKGLGAALIQDGKPVAFASKALTDVETRYANIERELLAVVYGCEKFHTYLFGRPFTVLSDHKPLESIHLKHLTAAPPRLQRMLLRLQPYDLRIKYVPGKEMLLADALSRLSPEEKQPIADMNVQIHEVCPQFSSAILQRIKEHTSNDDELVTLKRIVYEGWPTTIKKVPNTVKPYWSYRDEIAIDDGIMMKGHRIIIPATLQGEILTKLHASHQGAEKTKLRARSSVYWKNLNNDIDQITKSCPTCQEFQASQAKEPLIQTEIPPRPWHTISTDIFHLDGSEYLLVADYYSKFPFVRKIPKGQSNSRTIIGMAKQIFSEHGIPKVVRSDNGPHYFSNDYKAFAEAYGFQYVTSSPIYPRSNGFIERQVKTVKTLLEKAKKTNTDPDLALLCLRATPIDCNLPSPAELLLGRKVQDNLPRSIPRSSDNDEVTNGLKQRQELQKYYHDRNTKSLPVLQPGQKISIQDPATHRWKPAVLKEKLDDVPRSYRVTTPTGVDLRRNRVHIRDAQTPSQHIISTPKDAEQDTAEQTAVTKICPSGTTMTRSGRLVKPPNHYV